MATELARQRASGALRVGGEPGGTIYLRRGRLAFAESDVAPDLVRAQVMAGTSFVPHRAHQIGLA